MYLNDYTGFYYLSYFTLRAIGTIAEVWVQNNLAYQAGDPRMTALYNPNATDGRYYYPEVTDAQINYLLGEFENNI